MNALVMLVLVVVVMMASLDCTEAASFSFEEVPKSLVATTARIDLPTFDRKSHVGTKDYYSPTGSALVVQPSSLERGGGKTDEDNGGILKDLSNRLKIGSYFALWYALNIVYNSESTLFGPPENGKQTKLNASPG